MMDVVKLLQVSAVVVGLVTLAAAVFAVFRASLAKAQIEALRGDRDDLQKRVDRLEDENTDLEESNKIRDATINEQINKIHTLEKVVTGREQLNHLQKQLDAHDKRIDERHAGLSSKMDDVMKAVGALIESNETLIESNQYIQAALIDFLKKGAEASK